MSSKTLVVGGGPAGMIAAIRAGKSGSNVILLEKNDFLGKKLMITGKGRCNLTTTLDPQEIVENFPGNGYFLYGPIYSFSNYDLMDFFESLGIKLKRERGDRVFPESDKAKEIQKALLKSMENLQVKIKSNIKVTQILTEKDNSETRVIGVKTNKGAFYSDNIILATGGASYPATGSTGDGYKLASQLGHTIISPKPSLVPLLIKEKYVKDLQGLTLKNVSASLKNKNGKLLQDEFGEMLFTHNGVSGPIILSISRSATEYFSKNNDNLYLSIDFKPALDNEKLDQRIQRDFEKFTNKDFKNSLDDLLPKSLIPVVISKSNIDPDKKVNQITRKERQQLITTLKSFELTVTGTHSFEDAIVTAGGVSTKEISPQTLESKIIKNLYLAGEIIDIDGYTGGFNLQAAFSTGWVAGENAAY
ncbi:NAD(P)/FAD-dependent oxidoreductase [Natranaerobius trueperi]|uniref:Aminoacetone oxidase family FAD-binding enzyme n=1 Tax=Natranaerobius trueperi TaxID=759412 RepID=A0A226C204_9FIRM|nr:NAD(P)/FAD-dependent oxidoreductase [Natranaerobius trueperi]OWZ84410.1 aminoacetone oxidase family FAD-binding enzyme [Natranaerobius trueperi]